MEEFNKILIVLIIGAFFSVLIVLIALSFIFLSGYNPSIHVTLVPNNLQNSQFSSNDNLQGGGSNQTNRTDPHYHHFNTTFSPASSWTISEQEHIRLIVPEQSALVLIDVWDSPDYFSEESLKNIKTAVEIARKNNFTIIHANHGYPSALNIFESDIVLPASYWEISESAFRDTLKKNNIRYLFYAGYALNKCMINTPEGIFVGSKATLTANPPIILEDCTETVGEPDINDTRKMILSLWGEFISLEEFSKGLDQ